MNKAIILGRLTTDPVVRTTGTGKMVTSFTLAVDRYAGSKETDFLPVVCWEKTAENAGNSLSKGQRCLVEGRIQVRSFETKSNEKRWVTEVIAQSVEFIERRAQQDAPPREATPGDAASQFGQDVANYAADDPEIPF